ncbi:MAG: hypothetical protein R6U89_11665 [Dehalococcoidia bacterium]
MTIIKAICGALALIVCFTFAASIPQAATAEEEAQPPDESGPYNIGYYHESFYIFPYGIYTAKIRYPAKRDGWRAPGDMSGGPYPGVAMAGGTFQSDWMLDWAPEHLTSHGYVTICFTPPCTLSTDTAQWARGFNEALEQLKRANHSRFSPLKGVLDEESSGVLGYSMGGAGCIEASAINPEIDAIAALAPGADDGILAPFFESTVEACSNITAPIQLQVGSNDGNVLPEWVGGYYNLIPDTTSKEYLVINGANHFQFFDQYAAEFFSFMTDLGMDNAAEIRIEEQHRIARGYFTAWFNYFLKDLSGYETHIFGDRARADLDSSVLSSLQYNSP